MKRVLSQQEIDTLFSGIAASRGDDAHAATFDFSRLDRIPKSQVRVVHALFETCIRNVATSLAAYLRTYVSPTLVSLEQTSYGEFLEGLESPAAIAYVGLRPLDGTMLLGLSRPFTFGAIELLLGGELDPGSAPARKLTELEKNLVHNLLRVMLVEFREAWRSVADIHFEVQSLADDRHGLRVLTSAEAVVAVSIEMKIGSMATMINLAMPSIFIKRLRDRFDRLQNVQQSASRREDQLRMARLLRHVGIDFELRLDGGMVSSQDVADLAEGDVLRLDHPIDRPIGAFLNGHPMFVGRIGEQHGRLHYTIDQQLESE